MHNVTAEFVLTESVSVVKTELLVAGCNLGVALLYICGQLVEQV